MTADEAKDQIAFLQEGERLVGESGPTTDTVNRPLKEFIQLVMDYFQQTITDAKLAFATSTEAMAGTKEDVVMSPKNVDDYVSNKLATYEDMTNPDNLYPSDMIVTPNLLEEYVRLQPKPVVKMEYDLVDNSGTSLASYDEFGDDEEIHIGTMITRDIYQDLVSDGFRPVTVLVFIETTIKPGENNQVRQYHNISISLPRYTTLSEFSEYWTENALIAIRDTEDERERVLLVDLELEFSINGNSLACSVNTASIRLDNGNEYITALDFVISMATYMERVTYA